MVATSSVQQTKGFIQPQAPLENRLAGLTLTRLPQTTQSYAQDITTPADSDYLTKTTSAAQSLPRSDSMSTLELEGFKAQVHQDYALFTLLKVFLNEDLSLFEAHASVREFLQDQKEEDAYQERLLTLVDHLSQHPEQVSFIKTHEAKEYLDQFHADSFKRADLDTTFIVLQTNRLDKRFTHLDHTLVQSDDGHWFESFKSYNPTGNMRDNRLVADLHNDFLAPKGKARYKVEGEETLSALLGEGAFGKVVPLMKVANQHFYAAKKNIRTLNAQLEFEKGQALQKQFPGIEKFCVIPQHYLEFYDSHSTEGKKQTREKAYTISELVYEDDGADRLENNLELLEQGKTKEFQQENFKQVSEIIDMVLFLESHKMNHPDLHLLNILGSKMSDIGDMMVDSKTFPERGWSTPVTMPRVARRGTLTDIEQKTYNRFSLGSLIISTLYGHYPTSDKIPSSLSLKAENKLIQKGFKKEELKVLPSTFNNMPITPYVKSMLGLAKLLLADDRSFVVPEKLNLKKELARIQAQL
ncbi:MAG: hypothetical protein VX185_05425 [Pseudomonadota bacterium]|nr:hypothetical protein [Pseudomonadota bacterium]